MSKPKPQHFDKTMSFIDHLEQLRWHIIRSVIAVGLAMIVFFIFVKDIVTYIILGPLSLDFPTNKLLCKLNPENCTKPFNVILQATSPSEQFTRAITISLVGGIIVSFPYIVWEIWRFIRPGLYINEIKNTRGLVAFVSGLFFLGVVFTYFVILPFTLRFFAEFQLVEGIHNNWRIGEVISLVVQFVLGGGVLFQLPAVVYFLSKLGILTPALMRRFRKHAIIGSLIVAGILTPSPDVLSQLLLACPMYILYEISISISARIEKQRPTPVVVEERPASEKMAPKLDQMFD